MKITYAKIDGTSVEIEASAEYILQHEKELAWYKNKKAEEKAIEDKRKADAKSGNQKFLDMGLTQAEATALTGYIPPEESEE